MGAETWVTSPALLFVGVPKACVSSAGALKVAYWVVTAPATLSFSPLVASSLMPVGLLRCPSPRLPCVFHTSGLRYSSC